MNVKGKRDVTFRAALDLFPLYTAGVRYQLASDGECRQLTALGRFETSVQSTRALFIKPALEKSGGADRRLLKEIFIVHA